MNMAEIKKTSSIQIESVRPSVDGGRYPAKGIVGENCAVTADIFRDGFATMKAAILWRKKSDSSFQETPLTALPNDVWAGEFPLTENTTYVFTIEAWAEGSRGDATRHPCEFEVVADRRVAGDGAWYEFFVRSHGTLHQAEGRLREIKDMGFDVAYIAPVHPIGKTARKGPNNTLSAGPNDPGSPWAIGNETGGHTSVDPSLGTLADFDHFVSTAKSLGLEIAMDFAIQCSPDHPWLKEHPTWFFRNPDGSIKCAENPPHVYEDIVWLNFDSLDWKALWQELLSVVLFWVGHGVKIFRVDNPHTKPLPFWRWLIEEVRAKHPDVVFLSEAFTRPKMMKALSKAGFSQSYTYFTWRNTRVELTEYMKELTRSGMEDYFRPNFFVNTPDNLNEYLQKGGRPAFKSRLVLASTLSPAYGIYSGYELCENDVIPGTEQYAHSEIFEIKNRDWNAPGNIVDFVKRINSIRRQNPALHRLTNIKFFQTDNGQILFYCKSTPDKSNVILVLVNLDPFTPHHGTAFVPLEEIGVKAGGSYEVTDLITGTGYTWSAQNYVRLDPNIEPAHILRVERHF
jgi:starch synthase (maltosyl-transferring)